MKRAQSLASLRRGRGPEVKRFTADTGAVNPGALTPWKVNFVSAIAQGVTATDRVGDKITLTGIELSMVLGEASLTDHIGYALVAALDDDTAAANMLLAASPLSRPDPTVCEFMGAGWTCKNMMQFNSGGGNVGTVVNLAWKGKFPIFWDRAGNISAPCPVLIGCFTTGTGSYRVYSTVSFTDA